MPRLIADEPPKVRRLFAMSLRPFNCSYIGILVTRELHFHCLVLDSAGKCTLGINRKFQSKSGSSSVAKSSPRTMIRGLLRRFVPALKTTTRILGSSVSLVATTRQDVPPPTIVRPNIALSRSAEESVSNELNLNLVSREASLLNRRKFRRKIGNRKTHEGHLLTRLPAYAPHHRVSIWL